MWQLLRELPEKAPEQRVVFYTTLEELIDEGKRVIVLEADLGGASGSTRIRKSHPERYVECGIMEANMIGVAAGLSMRGFVPFAHTFAPFASRRIADQLFLEGAYAHNTMNIYASDPGVCAAQNGGTHTTFEDISIMRAIPGVEVFDPADGVQLKWLVRELAAGAYQQLGLEGQSSHTEGGITLTIDQLNERQRRQLEGFRLAIVG